MHGADTKAVESLSNIHFSIYYSGNFKLTSKMREDSNYSNI